MLAVGSAQLGQKHVSQTTAAFSCMHRVRDRNNMGLIIIDTQAQSGRQAGGIILGLTRACGVRKRGRIQLPAA